MTKNGKMKYGPGARDVKLFRSAANVLKTDDAFLIADHKYSTFTVGGWRTIGAESVFYEALMRLPANKTLKLWRLNRDIPDNTCYARVVNETDGILLDSHNDHADETGAPIHSWSYAAEKVIRFEMRNFDVAQHSMGAVWVITIED